MVPLPDNFSTVSDSLICFANEYRGRVSIRIATVYKDRESGDMALGRGVSVPVKEFESFVENLQDAAPEVLSEAHAMIEEANR